MTTFTNDLTTTTTSVMDLASRKRTSTFDYDEVWTLARQGNKDAQKALLGEIIKRLGSIEHVIAQMKTPFYYEDKQIASRTRQSARNYRDLRDMLKQIIAGFLPATELATMKNHKVLVEPFFGKFTDFDVQMLLIGMRKGGSTNNYHGIDSFTMPNYATFMMHEHGILFSINDQQYVISTDTASSLIEMAMKNESAARKEANALKKAGQLTLEKEQSLRKQLCHLQPVPFTQYCVFPNDGGITASYDGYTLVFKKGIEFLTKTDAVVKIEEPVRISMEYAVYKALVFPVAIQRGMGTKEKFGLHYMVAEMIFGKGPNGEDCNELPQTALAMQQFNDLCYYFIRGADDTFYPRTKEEQATLFQPGRYLAIRNFTCLNDIRYKYEECITAFNAERAKRAAENAAKRAGVAAPVVTSQAPAASVEEDEEYVFAEDED